ncbi:MAG: uroporphyrinogen-III synthase [Alteromonadaceae bacterium]|nr:MAG: uroporphyrinogen-III synthase [Alteromonadaceae bacterium]
MTTLTSSNYRVFATRPEQQNESWVLRLRSLSYLAVDTPMLAIVPVAEPKHLQAIRDTILRLDQFYALIFVSQNAVNYGFEWIDQFWSEFPAGLSCFAVGSKTEQCLRDCLDAIYPAFAAPLVSGGEAMTSEALLNVEALLGVESKKIAIFRGLGGRTKLQDSLTSRGALVEHCELYHRTCPAEMSQQLSEFGVCIESDIFPLFSGETLENFHNILVRQSLPEWQSVQLVVPGERVAKYAQALGFKRIKVALNASEPSMLNALSECTNRV